jgi:hypothetical protein
MQWRRANGRPATPYHRDSFQTGLLMLVCADVIRPGLSWMVRKASSRIVAVMTACRDPEGYAAPQDLIDADPGGIAAGQARLPLSRITMILACKGGMVGDVSVGDYLDLLDAMRETRTGGAGRLLAYRLLHALGHLGPHAPATGRAFLQAAGQRPAGQLVDRYQLQCRPVRDLLVDYLRERQPAVDYTTLSKLAPTDSRVSPWPAIGSARADSSGVAPAAGTSRARIGTSGELKPLYAVDLYDRSIR